MYIICVCVAFVVFRVRMLCVPIGWCIMCGLRPCVLYTEPVKRKIERIHAPTGSTSGVPGSEAGNMMHPVYVCACVQKARMHAHGVRRRCAVRDKASSTHACMWRAHGYVRIDWIMARVKAVTVSNKRTRGNVARWMYAFDVVGFERSALCAKEFFLSQLHFLPGSLIRASGPPACQTHSHITGAHAVPKRGYVLVVTVAGPRFGGKAPYFGRQTKLPNGATVHLSPDCLRSELT